MLLKDSRGVPVNAVIEEAFIANAMKDSPLQITVSRPEIKGYFFQHDEDIEIDGEFHEV